LVSAIQAVLAASKDISLLLQKGAMAGVLGSAEA
jgi:hypothetical protein